MNLCFVCSEYPPGPHGGIGTMTQVLARALVQRGHGVRVVGVCEETYPAPDYEVDQGVRVWRLRARAHFVGWVGDRYRVFRMVAAWARRGEIDLVEVPDWGGFAAGWPRLPIPVVVRLHGSATYFAAELGRSLRRTVSWLERASLLRADAWCSASRYAAEKTQLLFRMRKGPGAILPLPVEVPGNASTPRSHGQVVFTGTLTEKKGILSLVRAWPRVVDRCSDAVLHIFGKDGRARDGTSMETHLRTHLPRAVVGTVRFHGHVTRDRLFEALRRASVAVFPSYSEAFGIAPLEAMAHGCPTIYTRRGPGPEVLRHAVDGLLVDPDNCSEIADAIICVLRNPDLARGFGHAGRQRVRDTFCIDTVLPLSEAFYRGCLSTFQSAIVAGELQGTPRGPVASLTDDVATAGRGTAQARTRRLFSL